MKHTTKFIIAVIIMLSFGWFFGENLGINTGKETAFSHAEKHLDKSYVCPMHSQIIRGEKGNCPICGMDLVEVKQAAKKEILYWVAPMDANYRRDEPGKSPMGMDLVPVYEEGCVFI